MRAIKNRMRYTRQSITTNSFYQLPKFLFDAEFSQLSNDARILYALLRNRHEISVKNGWYDENDEVYLYFKREDMQNMLHLSDKTVKKAMDCLKEFLLLEEVRQGASKPNRIYLLSAKVEAFGIETAETLENTVTRKYSDSRIGDFTGHESEKLLVSKNHNNKIHNDVIQSESEPAPTEKHYGEFQSVRMTAEQYNALVTAYGHDVTADYINRLDYHTASTGKHYKNHYATIKKWIVTDESKPNAAVPVKPNRFVNFKQRNWNYEEIERLERQNLFESANIPADHASGYVKEKELI